MPLKMRRRDFLKRGTRAAACIALVSRASSIACGADDERWDTFIADIESRVPKLLSDHLVPGLSMAIITNGKLRWRRAFGVKDAASKEPVDVDTCFEAASMSKPVFAYRVMKLVETGVLDLDTPLTKYTSDRPLQGDPRLDLITARHVLSHTTGFQNWSSKKEPLKIHFQPGEKWQYSGEGYCYLQAVMAHLTRQEFDPYMRANVLTPFGMTSSGYLWNETFEKRMSRPHDTKGEVLKNNKPVAKDLIRYGAAGELRTTPTEYAKFLLEVIDPKPANEFRLKADMLREMLRPQVKVADTAEYAISWALGWKTTRTKDCESISHGGDNTGFHSYMEGCIGKKTGFVMMTNGENGPKLIGQFAPILARGTQALGAH